MGADVDCSAEHAGNRGEGKAHLESDHLLFRGAFRLAIPFAGAEASVEGDALVLKWEGGRARFLLGEKRAAAWAKKITNPPTRMEKAGVKPGMRVALVGISEAGVVGEVRAAGAEVTEVEDAQLVFWQVDAPGQLREVPRRAKALPPEGALWIVTPRGVPALADVVVMEAAKKAGLVDTKVMRFNDTHTALKWVHPRAKR